MASDWQLIDIDSEKIRQAENPATVVEDYIRSKVTGSGNFLYQVGQSKSVIQVDVNARKIFHCNLENHPANIPLKDSIKVVFPQFQFVDISGEERRKLALREDARDYQIHVPNLSEDEALNKIEKYRAKPSVHRFFSRSENQPQTQNAQQNSHKVSLKGPTQK